MIRPQFRKMRSAFTDMSEPGSPHSHCNVPKVVFLKYLSGSVRIFGLWVSKISSDIKILNSQLNYKLHFKSYVFFLQNMLIMIAILSRDNIYIKLFRR